MSFCCFILNLFINLYGCCSIWKVVFIVEFLCEMFVGEWFIVIFVFVFG